MSFKMKQPLTIITNQVFFFQVVSGIGDILFDHFDGSNGETMKRLFGNLCSKEGEILIFYKDMLKNDKKFAAFIKVHTSSV